jgi:hypothetical protein
MNNDDYPDDSVLTRELRESLSELAAPERPPLAAITGRGRAHQRRRLAGFAGVGGAGVAAGTALALGLTGAIGAAAPARGAGTAQAATSARSTGTSTGTIQTTAFTLTRNANGTTTLTLRLTMKQMFDPAELQRALAQDGIPALVKTGSYCSSDPAPPDPVGAGVLSVQPPLASAPHRTRLVPAGSKPRDLNQLIDDTVTVINPAKMPSETELFFGYSSGAHVIFTDLIYTRSYTCRGGQPPAT